MVYLTALVVLQSSELQAIFLSLVRTIRSFSICSLPAQGTEKYIMTKLHDVLFARYPEDRSRDEMLHRRITALQFLEPSHLEIPEDKVRCSWVGRCTQQI